MADLKTYSAAKLLSLHAQITRELKQRGITRSVNNPAGDVAEHLFCKAFGWAQAANSVKGYDAKDEQFRYQIKARRLHLDNKSRQLSALRNLGDKNFDYLAAVLFNPDYTVYRAAIIPHSFILQHSRRSDHTNSHLFILRDSVWGDKGVKDVTSALSKVIL